MSAGLQIPGAASRQLRVLLGGEVLQHCQHGDDVEWFHRRHIAGKKAANQRNRACVLIALERRIDPYSSADASACHLKKDPIRASDVQKSRTSRNKWKRLLDPPALEHAVQEPHN